MHDNDVLPSRSLDSKELLDCNLPTIVEPHISREACAISSKVEKVDGSELETRILCADLASTLDPKVTYDLTLVLLLPIEVKLDMCELESKRHETETKAIESV